MGTPQIYTVGHSTHPLPEFIALLEAHDVAEVVDVRTVPKSRHNPQFMTDSMQETLPAAGLKYRHVKDLGGLRPKRKDSINGAWRNDSFRGYADYMQTTEFAAAVNDLLALANTTTVAIMCAEAVPWRCHRSLIGDALLVRGAAVLDIMSEKSAPAHKLTSFAHVDGLTITYPPQQEPLLP